MLQNENELGPKKPNDLFLWIDLLSLGKEYLEYVWETRKKKALEIQVVEDTPVVMVTNDTAKPNQSPLLMPLHQRYLHTSRQQLRR